MALLLIVIVSAFAYWYADLIKPIIDSGSWFWFSVLMIWPFVLGYFVGNEEDRADYHKIFNWLLGRGRR